MSGGNKEKFTTGEGEHKKWNTYKSQEQEQHGKITISAQRESRPSHEKHDPQDKENGRKLNEREMKTRRKERNGNRKILVKRKDKLQMMDKVWKRK